MTAWLYQHGLDDYAHAYPDDDSIEVAACGYKLKPEDCPTCGHTTYTTEPNQWVPKCSACQRAITPPVALVTKYITIEEAPEPVLVRCPRHVRPCPIRGADGRFTGKHVAIGVECPGSELPLIGGRWCRDSDCHRDMTYKLNET